MPPGTAGDASTSFMRRFAEDSAEAGLARELAEQRARAERLLTEGAEDEALQAFEEAAHAAVGLKDRASEAEAVIGMAKCLSKPATVDAELVAGMYRYAETAAAEVGDYNLKFRAITGHAALQRSLRKFAESEIIWDAALALAKEHCSEEQTCFALTQLGLTLLHNPEEVAVDVVDGNKENAGHLSLSAGAKSGDGGGLKLRSGASQRAARAVRLLTEVTDRLPEAASVGQQAVARVNLVAALQRLGGTRSNNRKIERELVRAYQLLREIRTSQELRRSVVVSLLQHYDENPWLVDGNPEAAALSEELRAQVEAAGAKGPRLHAAKEISLPQDPEERHALERARWADEKLRLQRSAEAASGSDSDHEAPARPTGDGWQL